MPRDSARPAGPDNGLRVLHLYRRFSPDFTGDGIYYEKLIDLASRTDPARHEVLVFEAPACNAGLGRGQDREPRAIHYLQDRPGPATQWRLIAWIARNIGRFDILHVHTHIDRHFASYLIARAVGCKVIYSSTLEDSIPDLVQTYRSIYHPFVRFLFGRLDAVVAISPRLYSGGKGISPDKALLIPQGVTVCPLVEPHERLAVRRALGLDEDQIVLLYVGSLIPRKGILFLLEQFRSLFAHNRDLRLFLIGPATDPTYGTAVETFIRTHGLADAVTHIPFVNDPWKYYAASDIFVFASLSEGFGNVLLEAMSAGLPIVSRYLPDVTTSFIDHGCQGFLFSTPEQFRDQVDRLVGDPALRRRMGSAGRARVLGDFEIGAIKDRVFALYHRLKQRQRLTQLSDPLPRDCGGMSAGPLAVGLQPLRYIPDRPILSLVVDTESEFVWSKGVTDDKGSVESIAQLSRAQDICDPFGARICYVLDHPVASNPSSVPVLRTLIARGAEIGAHLQPWTTPPIIEPLGGKLAFPGNLPASLERLKLAELKLVIEQNFGITPRVYKAGRYGISENTLGTLEELGFDVDLSVTPGFDYTDEGGPDFSRFAASPYHFGRARPLLELPTTSGFVGYLAPLGKSPWETAGRSQLRGLHLRGLMDRTGGLSRLRLACRPRAMTWGR